MRLSELERLISGRDATERSEVDPESLRRDSEKDLEEIDERLQLEMARLTLEARRAADAFWQVRQESQEAGLEPGRLGTQVRMHNGLLQAIWFTGSFTHTDPTSGKKKFYAKHLSKSRGRLSHRYPASTFKASPEWEQDIATTVEEYYAIYRKKAQMVSDMRKLLRRMRALPD